MKLTIFISFLLSIIIVQSGHASTVLPEWKLGLSGWFADGSNFDEQPGPDTTGHIWGDFPTNFYEVKLSKSFFNNTTINLSIAKLYMLAGWMYLNSDTIYTDFNGEGLDLKIDYNYRLSFLNTASIDLGIGYQYVSAIKRFSNLKDNGTIIREGNWGNYNIIYQGPMFLASLHYWFIPELDIFGTIIGSPIINNETEVSGYPEPIHEKASGLRYHWKTGINYSPIKPFVISGGYRFEDIYFNEPSSDSFSLHIIYSGLFLEAGYCF